MKSIFTYIISLFLVTNFAYGSQDLDHILESQIISYEYYDWEKDLETITTTKKYLNTDYYFTKKESSKNDSPNYNWLQLKKYRLGLYTSLVDRYIHQDKTYKINNPKSREFDITELPFFLSRYCLENLDHYIQQNLKKQKDLIKAKNKDYCYFDEVPLEELQRRIDNFEKEYNKRCKQDSEDEAPASKRQHTKS